jgi:crossover junction endodeoxyribonuclease RusA
MTTHTITFAPPDKRLSMNDRLHHMARHRRVSSWRHAAGWAALASAPIRLLEGKPSSRSFEPSFVRVSFPVTHNRRRDADNPAPTVKAIVDGLVDAGMWPDDTPEWVETLGSRFVKGATEVVVEIIPRGEMAA